MKPANPLPFTHSTMTLLVLLVAAFSAPAHATMRTIEQAYELTRSQVRLPKAVIGGLTIRLCPECSPVVLRVTAATGWFSAPDGREADGQAAVQKAWEAAGRESRLLVYVYYEPGTKHVNRIVLDVPPAESRQ